nr:unnamed protein product [Callosobruchus chinensis]
MQLVEALPFLPQRRATVAKTTVWNIYTKETLVAWETLRHRLSQKCADQDFSA